MAKPYMKNLKQLWHLNMQQQVTVAGLSKKHTRKLPGRLELMVTMNIATEADLENGARGEIVDIVLDPREFNPHRDEETSLTRLQYPPAMILFKPYHYTFGRLEGLLDGVIPIFPSEIKFNIPHQGQMIRCLPTIMASYAFTDYKSQGQTIECVIVDLGKPPWGALTAFNTYVALSWSQGKGVPGKILLPRVSKFFWPPSLTPHPHLVPYMVILHVNFPFWNITWPRTWFHW